MARRLSLEERQLWAKVVESVRPLRSAPLEVSAEAEAPAVPGVAKLGAPLKRAAPSRISKAVSPAQSLGITLDGSWDRRLGRGAVQPDISIDLHGHNLATAYSLLDRRLEQAIASGVRVVLLITGKPPRGEPPIERGRIRAAVGDWLSASRHAGSIAAVRNAHPRHGGAGALYIILRRPK